VQFDRFKMLKRRPLRSRFEQPPGAGFYLSSTVGGVFADFENSANRLPLIPLLTSVLEQTALRMLGLEQSSIGWVTSDSQSQDETASSHFETAWSLISRRARGRPCQRVRNRREEIMELFCKLNAAGTTIVQVTHSETNASYGQRVIRLKDGWLERALRANDR
jgi:hypothetical protein